MDLFGGKSNKETAAIEIGPTAIEAGADLFLADNTTQRKNESMHPSNNFKKSNSWSILPMLLIHLHVYVCGNMGTYMYVYKII